MSLYRQAEQQVSHGDLTALLEYQPNSGVFIWKDRPSIGTPKGSVAGTTDKRGYRQIRIKRSQYRAHRLAFLYMTGCWPAADIDHIDGDKANNRWANLREATRSQNCANRGATKRNSSGHKRVRWNEKLRKWQAAICVKYKTIHLGVFDDIGQAKLAYEKAALEHFGEFARK